MKHLLTFALFLLSFSWSPAESLKVQIFPDGSSLEVSAPIGILPSGGFFPVRIDVLNKGTDTGEWIFECRADGNVFRYTPRGQGSKQITSRFSVSCPAGEAKSIELLIPVHQKIGFLDRNLVIRGEEKDGDRGISAFFSRDSEDYCFAVSNGLLQTIQSDLYSHWSSLASRSYSHRGSGEFYGGIDVEKLPEDWRAYAGYDALVFSRQDLTGFSPGVRVALDQWVRSGGHMIVLNDGDGVIEGFESPSQISGFGRKSVLYSGAGYGDFEAQRLGAVLKGAGMKLSQSVGSQYSIGAWRVGSELGRRTLQTSLLLLALVIFAIIVGPVNLFVWANKNRRHRLFVTTPIISIVASLLLVGFIMLQDGFGGNGARAVAIDVGGPGDKSASIVQEQFTRSGILLSSGFEMDDDSVLHPVRPPSSDFNREDSTASLGNYALTMKPTKDGWDISGNLFESRSEQAHVLRSVVPSRERLKLVSGGGENPKLVSSFSYSLSSVFYVDEIGGIWKSQGISSGETGTFSASDSDEMEEVLGTAIGRFAGPHRNKLRIMVARPNSFVALADEAPSIATHTSIDWKESPALITGLLK